MRQNHNNHGLYESRREHDGCGIGAVVNISGQRSHSIIEYGKEILLNLRHRGAASADEITGDGAGILFQIPHKFFEEQCSRSFALYREMCQAGITAEDQRGAPEVRRTKR